MSKRSKAVIWDMDGVIADTAPYHFRAWQDVFQKHGKEYSKAAFSENFGKRNDAIIKNVLGGDTPDSLIDTIANEKEANFRKQARGNIKPLPGVIDLMTALNKDGVVQALGSSAPLENIQLIIREIGIGDYLKVIISGRDVKEGKPSPQGFLLAAEKLDVSTRDCVVIEDAVAGVAAAKRAGMKCLAVTNTNPAVKLAEADIVINSLERITLDDMTRLLNQP